MRSGHIEIDPKEPNFVVPQRMKVINDSEGRRIGTCDKIGKSPIRATILDGNITDVYCGAVHTCLECPFKSVLLDQTDFKKQVA